jgi:hypothetical protein
LQATIFVYLDLSQNNVTRLLAGTALSTLRRALTELFEPYTLAPLLQLAFLCGIRLVAALAAKLIGIVRLIAVLAAAEVSEQPGRVFLGTAIDDLDAESFFVPGVLAGFLFATSGRQIDGHRIRRLLLVPYANVVSLGVALVVYFNAVRTLRPVLGRQQRGEIDALFFRHIDLIAGTVEGKARGDLNPATVLLALQVQSTHDT